MNVQIRIMNENDAVEVAKISILSFSSPWSTESYIQEIKNPVALYLVAVINNNIVGFIGTWNVLDESHITNVAVHPDFRKQKIGSLLLENLINTCEKQHNTSSFDLEVRANNKEKCILSKNNKTIEKLFSTIIIENSLTK